MKEKCNPLQQKLIRNPFNAPVFHITTTDSTMQDARCLVNSGFGDGTVIYADYQEKGRGRLEERTWISSPGKNLLCTTILERKPPAGFTLRVGLAVAMTFDMFFPSNQKTQIKWPNDVLWNGKKLSGILCENDGRYLYAGTGLNIGVTEFPPEIADTASSMRLVIEENSNTVKKIRLPAITEVLECYLKMLYGVLEMNDWHHRVTEKLFRKGEHIKFLTGDPKENKIIEGVISGIGSSGELLIFQNTEYETNGKQTGLFSGEILRN